MKKIMFLGGATSKVVAIRFKDEIKGNIIDQVIYKETGKRLKCLMG